MKLVLLLFSLLSFNVMAKGLLHFELDCRKVTFYGTVNKTKVYAIAEYTWQDDKNRWQIRLRAKNYPGTDGDFLMSLAKGIVNGTADDILNKRKVGMLIVKMTQCPTHKPKVYPQSNKPEPAPNPIIKTGIRLTIRKEDEGCV